jgi:Protein of unknown function (DUF3040)
MDIVRAERAMPLSEHEQRILAEIERRLLEEDPKFAQQVGSSFRAHLARRMKLAVAAFLLGLVVVVFGFTQSRYLGLAGFVTMIAAVLVFVQALRRRASSERRPGTTQDPPPAQPQQRGRRRGGGGLDAWWSRMNDRWRQRWDERGGPPER